MPVQNKTVTISNLPQNKSSVLMTVKVNGVTQFEQTIDTSSGSVSVNISGSGASVWVDVYFDGTDLRSWEEFF
ncbi:hypothetical protein LJC32_00300 [Oscillospiraceae bacterium OttesenSCG-928-F05]|nr:hypothetical protein [Oscillospiraceae bacterium OttesenSCG-928-F05]